MIKRKKCSREFKSPQALGGHMRGGHQEETREDSNHLDNPEEVADTVAKTEEPRGETALVPQETRHAEQEWAVLPSWQREASEKAMLERSD